MNAPTRQSLVACGLYASTPSLQNAWRALFSALAKFLHGCGADPFTLVFRTDDETYRDRALLLGHACGYPWLKKWAATHRPVCVPLFAVDGCEGARYSSWFITSANSTVTDLASARGKSVAVNNADSNSGMNVLRHALAELCDGEKFFAEVLMSGSHQQSIELVASERAQLAAIDAITFAFAMTEQPALQKRIRIIGQSAHTTAPPFIAPLGVSENDYPVITDALNECLRCLDEKHRHTLKLRGFQQVTTTDYDSILALEKFAQERGYAEIG